jgi:chromosome segregation ATPase
LTKENEELQLEIEKIKKDKESLKKDKHNFKDAFFEKSELVQTLTNQIEELQKELAIRSKSLNSLNEDLLKKQESNDDLETRNQELEAANDSLHYHLNDLILQNQFLEGLAYPDSPLAEGFIIPDDSKNKEQTVLFQRDNDKLREENYRLTEINKDIQQEMNS